MKSVLFGSFEASDVVMDGKVMISRANISGIASCSFLRMISHTEHA